MPSWNDGVKTNSRSSAPCDPAKCDRQIRFLVGSAARGLE